MTTFIDDRFAMNDSGEFGRSICGIYPKELELKVEHQGEIMLRFFNLYV